MATSALDSFRLSSDLDPEKAKEQLLRLADLDPEFALIYNDPKFVSPFPNFSSFDDAKIQKGRAPSSRLKAFIASQPVPASLRIANHSIPSSDASGYQIQFRTYVPNVNDDAESSLRPIYLRIHGGGFCMCSLEDEELHCRAVAVGFNASVVNVDYRKAPENPFPTGLNDVYEILKWTIKPESQKEVLFASTTKGFILSGASSAANFAAMLSIRARDDALFKENRPTGVILQIPNTCDASFYPEKYKRFLLSGYQLMDSPNLSGKDLGFLRAKYNAPDADPDAFPIYASSHTNLPPTFFQVAGMDPMRDEGLVYEMVLREAGVATKMALYPGLPHWFSFVWPKLKASRKWQGDFNEGTKWLLSLV